VKAIEWHCDRVANGNAPAGSSVERKVGNYTKIAKGAWAHAQEHNAGLLAAGIAYYAFLSFIPLLAASILTYGVIADPQTVAQHAASLAESLPASASDLVIEQLDAITDRRSGTKGLALIAAIAISLFGARVAAGAVIKAFNVAFEAREGRGFVKANLLALCITIGAILAAGLLVAATALVAFVLPGSGGAFASFLAVGLAGLGGTLLAYRIVPNVDHVTFADALRGAIPFALLWMIASAGFGFYASNFGNYNATYGSLGAIVVLLTWLFLSAYALLLGAHIAAESRRANR
jgi:membrane protein